MLAEVDPITCLTRGLIAYWVGSIFTQLWYVFFTIRVQKASELATEDAEAVQSGEPEPSDQDEITEPVAKAS